MRKKSTLYSVEVKIITRKRIEEVMNAKDKERTGLTKLSPKELGNLGSWLDTNGVVAPGDQPHIE
jgi:hypothetical protein